MKTLFINSMKYPEDEHEHIGKVVANFHFLSIHNEDINDAISLYFALNRNYEQQRKREYLKWMLVPARDGAISLYHYCKMIEFIRNSFKLCPVFRSKVKIDELRDAQKKFQEYFPFAKELRNAVAHSAELVENDQKIDRNAVRNFEMGTTKIVESKTILRSHLDGNTFMYTIDGEVVFYNLTNDTLNALAAVTNQIHSAFPDDLNFHSKL
ncbi:hypothetical protein [Niveispirillum lacus]|uniref:hypothetical protein n=1 Tax=Niveispirillum lacus TaxID=1981099 RepID=UPI0010553FC5|nr:hypothetical protein [Niveispirillum lacus]